MHDQSDPSDHYSDEAWLNAPLTVEEAEAFQNLDSKPTVDWDEADRLGTDGTYVFTGITKGVIASGPAIPAYQQTQRFWANACKGSFIMNGSGPFFSLLPGKTRKERRAAWAKLRAHGNRQRHIHNASSDEAYVPHVVTSHWWRDMWVRAEVSP